MGNGELTLVKSLNEFMEWASQFNQGGYLFRGVTNEEYDISASTYRRLKNGDESRDIKFEKFVQINRGLIGDVRLQDMDWKNGRKLRDLEILAELQHFRAATCLIDFTYNALIALWFACYQESENATRCGKVVAVRVDKEHQFREVTLELLKKDIDYFFLGNENRMHQQLYKWQPPHQNSRIIAQQSIFLFGTVEINPDKECIILGSKKQEILESLEQVHGISEAMLFPDFEGFARQHRQSVPYTQLAASQYRKRGVQKAQERKFEEAIDAFSKAINIDPGNSSDYQNRGAAREGLLSQSGAREIKQYKGVRDDYTEAINLDPNAPVSYYRRGMLIASKGGRMHEAFPDLEKALQIAQAIGEEKYIEDIQRDLQNLRQAVRQFHDRAGVRSEDE